MEKQKIISSIAFDVNGTLVDDTATFLTVINMMLRRLELQPLPHEKLRREFGQPWTKIFRDRGVRMEVWPEEKLYDMYNGFYTSFGVPKLAFDAARVLRDLHNRNISLALVSTQKEHVTMQSLTSIAPLFSVFLHGVSDKVQALRRVQAQCGPLAYVGDQVGDMRAARGADVVSIAYTGGLHTKDMLEAESPDFVINEFKELLKLPS
ncbi:HAD family hydrolase [Candidatus Jorgensenbacteria bacterium]|nr:HAD family hydrolase [Candidatus Jorgensenbacteria bacterium]